jgi:hypothetical protein
LVSGIDVPYSSDLLDPDNDKVGLTALTPITTYSNSLRTAVMSSPALIVRLRPPTGIVT